MKLRRTLVLLVLPVAVAYGDCCSNVVHGEARRILANIRATHYIHRTEVNEKEGMYNLNCSGLATLILKNVAPAHLRAVRHAENKSRPRAFEFYEAFAAAPTNATTGWLRIKRVLDACPGDFVA